MILTNSLLPRLLCALCFVCVNLTAHAADCTGNADPCGKPTSWNEFESVRLQVNQAGAPPAAAWYVLYSRGNGDLRVDIDVLDPKKRQHGTILMVEGRTMVSRGVALLPGQEIDSLDAPLLSVFLLEKILGRALPNGPSGLAGRQRIDFEDKQTGIQFATPSAEGFIPAPWSVSGEVVSKANGAVDFTLTLKSVDHSGKVVKESDEVFTGQFAHVADFRIDSDMPLDGWAVFGVGPTVKHTQGGTMFDYGATPATTSPKTIADIRKDIAVKNSPGAPDPSFNFAGFWKGSCSDGFGLRIKPQDKPGAYTVTFCGPGGCGNGQNERMTYITGDPHYKVVSATVLEVGSGDSRSTYTKCSDGLLP